MTLSLLCRAEGVVSRIQLNCPEGIAILPNVVPFGHATDLRTRLVDAIREIDIVPIELADDNAVPDCEIFINTIPESMPRSSIMIIGAGWWGGAAFATQPPAAWTQVDLHNPLPIGPYIAATLAVADVYLQIRDPRAVTGSRAYGWNAWTCTSEVGSDTSGTVPLGLDLSGIALAGVGAVGTAWMATLWATSGLSGSIAIVDSDAKGVSSSNLNRGLLFRRRDIGLQKAEVAATAAKGTIDWRPINGRFESSDIRPSLLVSAVDTNTARDAIQSRYPARTLSGSTRDLRAETMVGGRPGDGACLRCYNPLEAEVSDAQLRARVEQEGAGVLDELARGLGISNEELANRLEAPGCDAISDRLLAQLRAEYGDDTVPARFAVGFTSAMAGVLLAGETLRLMIHDEPDGIPDSKRVTFQFRRPESSINGRRVYPRDAVCPKCDPAAPSHEIWASRYDRWTSKASGKS
ncbi:ThiF family adenylyltransferase [Luethyella okanaganae]|uniref:ThiF family adenylyltransferase n=1 Tax=Luethyella okanaganae TaxID=69372 RepID=A0ABW1VF03_9MICO